MISLEKEFKEYRQIYNTFSDALKEESKNYEELRDKIIAKDKEDIQMQNDSKEKQSLLDDLMFLVYKISLIQNDLVKVGERLLYIKEAAIRTDEEIKMNEEDIKFMESLSANSSSTYVIEGGTLVSKVQGLEDVIRKKVAENKDTKYIYLDNIRKSKEYQNV